MTSAIDGWIRQSQEKILSGAGVTLQDLDALRDLQNGEQQHLLYIWAEQDRIDAGVIAWNYFGPFDSEFRFDPKNECPYASAAAAMADGWRVVSFPGVEYPLENAHNQLGFEFILERYFQPGEGLDFTPHGQRQ